MAATKIEWSEEVWNPVVGCDIVSPGCTNCYAMRDAYRKGFNPKLPRYHGLTKMTKGGPVWIGEVRTVPELLDAPLYWKKPRRIFVNSMSDLFHEDVPDEFIDKVFAVMALCPQHTFQILTKRAERMFKWATRLQGSQCAVDREGLFFEVAGEMRYGNMTYRPWPLPNVWLLVSVEDQPRADERIPLLLRTPAAVRGISVEPLLGPILLRRAIDVVRGGIKEGELGVDHLTGLNWVVVGGESGPGARPFDIAWARSLRDQCRAAGVPFFLKQFGAFVVGDANDPRNPGLSGDTPMIGDGRDGAIAHFRLTNHKGGDPQEWPEDLRIREYPR